jgi:nucleoside phosphorylase
MQGIGASRLYLAARFDVQRSEVAMPLVDFAIIAGLIEEFGDLGRLVPELVEEDKYQNSEIWYRGTIVAKNDTRYSVVAAFQTAMGPQQASALTAKIIQRWDPAYIILIGISGFISPECQIRRHHCQRASVFH